MKHYTLFGAMVTVAALNTSAAWAGATTGNSGLQPVATTTYTDQSFSTIFERITQSFGGVTGLISMFAYLMGIIFAIGGILKIKDHVEQPEKTELKSGAIRLVIGGALFALPTIMTMMTSAIGNETSIGAPQLKAAGFGVVK